MSLKQDTTRAWFVPAAQRKREASSEWRSCYSFQASEQLPIDCALHSFTEHTLAATTALTLTFPKQGTLVLLPTAGGIQCSAGINSEHFIPAGSLLVIARQAGETVTLHNTSATHLANVLAFYVDELVRQEGVYDFNLPANFNKLVMPLAASPTLSCQLQLGMYAGRAEDGLQLSSSQCLLAYIIEGAFEVQNRLMERGDSLLLWNCNSIDYEALSEHAIILLLVCSNNTAKVLSEEP